MAEKSYVTIVTCYYFVKNKRNCSKDKYDEEILCYTEWITNFMKLKTPKIIFCDNKTKPYLEKFTASSNIRFINKPIDDFITSTPKFDWNYQSSIDPRAKKNSIDIYKIWNEKFNFIKHASDINPFQSSFFMWCDIGCFRKGNLMNTYINWPNESIIKKINKPIFCNIFPFNTKQLDNPFELDNRFKENWKIGGLFGIPLKDIPKMYIKYYNILYKMDKLKLLCCDDQYPLSFLAIQNLNDIHLVNAPSFSDNYYSWMYLHEYLK